MMKRICLLLVGALLSMHALSLPANLQTGKINNFESLAGAQNRDQYFKSLLETQPLVMVRFVKDSCPNCSKSNRAFSDAARAIPEMLALDVNYQKSRWAQQIVTNRNILSVPAFLYYKDGALVKIDKQTANLEFQARKYFKLAS